MSDLLLIIVVLGAIIVVGVVVFNWWQEQKYQKRIANDFKPTKRDALFDSYPKKTLSADASPQKKPSRDSRKQQDVPFERKEPVLDDPVWDDTAPTAPHIESFEETPQETLQPIASEEIVESPHEFEEESTATSAISSPLIELEDIMDNPLSGHALSGTPQSSEEMLLPDELHHQIDLVAILYASSPITNVSLLQAQKPYKGFTERTFVFGLTAGNVWQLVDEVSDIAYTQVAYALQLADRAGAVNRATLNRFQHMVETIGLEMKAHVEWQGTGDPLNRANLLDQFCIEVDKTIGFHLIARDGATFHATKLRGLAESQGLQLGQAGRFLMFNANDPGHLEYSMQNLDDNPFTPDMLKTAVMHGVTFQLDIPTVRNSTEVFDAMVITAKQLGKSLDAAIVDDYRKELSDIHLEKIRQQLKKINAQMIAKGIIPGSSHALRLFS